MISIRTKEEIEKINKAFKIPAQALELAGSLCCKGNVFVNDMVIHGIP